MHSDAENEPSRDECAESSGSYRRRAMACLIAASLVVGPESTARGQGAGSGPELQFDIPSQPLASSLKTYSAITGLDLYHESSLTNGYVSPSLRGSFSPEAAIRRLLEGTGLSVESFDSGTVTILAPRRDARDQELAAIKSKAAEFTPYFARIQASLRAAFCRMPSSRTELVEIIIRLWISPSGVVARAEIVSPTGRDGRDLAHAAAVLRSLGIGEPPPRGMPQPVTLMVLPQTSRTAAECPQPGALNSVRASTDE